MGLEPGLLLFGGEDGEGDKNNESWAYNYTENTWTNMSPDTFGGTLWKR